MSTRPGIAHLFLTTFFDKASLITFAFKISRLVLSLIALNGVHTLFKQWYSDADDDATGDLPSLFKFVFVYFAIDLAINLIISLLMITFIDEDITKASLVDYLIGVAIAFKMSLSAAQIFSDPKSFDYVSDGITLIATLKRFVTLFMVINMFIPYYLMVRHIIH